jgi:bifunctional ADP-heptose synthase (sugar kinase/adenylyltransferase)
MNVGSDDEAPVLTHLLDSHVKVLPPETKDYLRVFEGTYSATGVIARLQELRQLRVLVVGEAIIDEYHFCRPYGIASKSSAVASQFINSETYAGGALAVANHLAGFCSDVHLVTTLGGQDSRESFIRERLKPNITPKFFFRSDAPTVIKRRYVQPFLATKLFEIAYFNDHPLPADTSAEMCGYLSEIISSYDLVVVSDFGHGMLNANAVDVLTSKSEYLALNVQMNSINHGYNIVTKYPRADYVCIDEQEARMARHEMYGSLDRLMESLSTQLEAKLMTVTLGHQGSRIHQSGSPEFLQTPVFSTGILDATGAGDALLSITALCARMGHPPDFIGFVGNAVGALAVQYMGNAESIQPDSLHSFVASLLGES